MGVPFRTAQALLACRREKSRLVGRKELEKAGEMASFTRSLQLLEAPAKLVGSVVHGFGRGSAQLGFPTANLSINWSEKLESLTEEERSVRRFVDENKTGIYAAWAQVADGEDRGVYKVRHGDTGARESRSFARRRWR